MQPRAQPRIACEAIDRAEGRREGVLNCIRSLLLVRKQPPSNRVQAAAVAAHDRLPRVIIPEPRSIQQVGISVVPGNSFRIAFTVARQGGDSLMRFGRPVGKIPEYAPAALSF